MAVIEIIIDRGLCQEKKEFKSDTKALKFLQDLRKQQIKLLDYILQREEKTKDFSQPLPYLKITINHGSTQHNKTNL